MAPPPETPNQWYENWQESQQQYWQAWQQACEQLFSQTGDEGDSQVGDNPWAKAIEQYQHIQQSWIGADGGELYAKVLDLGKTYLSIGETFWQTLNQASTSASKGGDWQSLVTDAYKNLLQAFRSADTGFDPNLYINPAVASLWSLPVDTWQRVAHYFSAAPGDLHKGLNISDSQTGAAGPKNGFAWWLSMPAVGYTREWQTQYQQWGELSQQYIRAMQDYILMLGEVSKRAVDILSDKLSQLSNEKKPADSMRAIYDLWVDSGEEAYAEFVAKPEFSNLQAQQVNALMRLKQHEQRMIEQTMATLNMPTRSELDTTHRRVHQLQRELRKLETKFAQFDEASSPRNGSAKGKTKKEQASKKNKTAAADKQGEDNV